MFKIELTKKEYLALDYALAVYRKEIIKGEKGFWSKDEELAFKRAFEKVHNYEKK